MGALNDRASDWQVLPEGLEHRPTGYFIEGGALAARRADGHWEWPLHMAEKTWCAPRAFRDAFLSALAAFGLDPDSRLAESFDLARTGREGRIAQAPLDRPVPLAEVCRGLGPIRAAGRRPIERDAERGRAMPAAETRWAVSALA